LNEAERERERIRSILKWQIGIPLGSWTGSPPLRPVAIPGRLLPSCIPAYFQQRRLRTGFVQARRSPPRVPVRAALRQPPPPPPPGPPLTPAPRPRSAQQRQRASIHRHYCDLPPARTVPSTVSTLAPGAAATPLLAQPLAAPHSPPLPSPSPSPPSPPVLPQPQRPAAALAARGAGVPSSPRRAVRRQPILYADVQRNVQPPTQSRALRVQGV